MKPTPTPHRALRITLSAAVAVALTVTAAVPASADDTHPETTTSTTTPPDTTPPSSSSTTTTVPPPTTTTTTTTPPGSATTVPAPIDEHIEVPHEVPHGELDVDTSPPPSGPWDDAPTINPALSNLVAARSAAADRLHAVRDAAAEADAAAAAATRTRERLEGDASDAVATYQASTERFSARVAAMYVAAGDIDLTLRPTVAITEAADAVVVAGAISEADNRVVAEHLEARDRIEGALAEAVDAETAAHAAAKVAAAALADAEAAMNEIDAELSATPADIAGFVFPIAGRTSFISSFGFCRDGCRRSHQGNDLFADRGAPVVAVEDGWVERVGTNRLGGLIVWTRGRSGYRYYYAHLDTVAPLIAGAEITAGTPIGTVGDSGNAKGTPPHLHFEIHPPAGGGAIDPYPILVRAPRVTLIDTTSGHPATPEAAAAAPG